LLPATAETRAAGLRPGRLRPNRLLAERSTWFPRATRTWGRLRHQYRTSPRGAQARGGAAWPSDTRHRPSGGMPALPGNGGPGTERRAERRPGWLQVNSRPMAAGSRPPARCSGASGAMAENRMMRRIAGRPLLPQRTRRVLLCFPASAVEVSASRSSAGRRGGEDLHEAAGGEDELVDADELLERVDAALAGGDDRSG